MKPIITILTPTYNRSKLLYRVYNSLVTQTNKSFEWIIVDDGSIDDTKNTVKEFNDKSFRINYLYKKNGGKHTALNFGINHANGKFILMLDSDDFLPSDAIEKIMNKASKLPNDLGGIVGRKSYIDGRIVGSNNKYHELISNSIDIRYIQKVVGDLTEVFKTDILKNNPFPEIEGEYFCPEVLVWNRIALKYNLLFFNESIYIADYQPQGLTNSIIKIRMQSPKASMLTYSELAKHKIPLLEKIKANINFWRFSFNDKDWSITKKLKMINICMLPITYPIGYLLYCTDKIKTK